MEDLAPILIIDGTELVGAKQNRIVNASFLIPPESVTRIPVSCVEQGRWGYKGREFGASRHFSPHRIRRDNAEFHKTSLRQNRGYATGQGKVWAHVADMSHKMGAPTIAGKLNGLKAGQVRTPRYGWTDHWGRVSIASRFSCVILRRIRYRCVIREYG